MKTALMKDTLREIKHSFSRFLSIFLIVFLGCGFYAGVNSTMPDMKETAEAYFEENNLSDVRLVSTIGIKAEDIAAIKHLDSVEGVMAGYSKDVFCKNDNENLVLKFMSWNGDLKDTSDNINHLVLIEGRLPENPGECVVDEKFYGKDENFSIGKTITVTSPYKDEDINDVFSTDTFEIVGYVTTPLYVGYERDKTTVGNGTVYGFVFINEYDFTMDYYSELYVTLNNCDYEPFSDEYINAVDEQEEKLLQVFNESVMNRYNYLYSLNFDRITSAQNTVSQLEKILNSDLESLYDLKIQAQELVLQYEKQAETDNSSLMKIKLSNAKSKLSELKTLILAKENNNQSVLNDYNQQIADAKAEIKAGKEELSKITDPVTLSYNRYSSTDYGSFDSDSQKIHSIAKVFPVFFIIVATLVCLTTMTRMIEEQRTQIGTYKAIGYTNRQIVSKYLFYGVTAAALGSLLGTLVGVKTLPVVIYNCYKILYNIPKLVTPVRLDVTLICVITAVLLTAITVVFSCYKELYSQPSQLMRPKAPKSGRRVLLEKFPKIWNKIGFIGKVTIRNLLRYKKRFFMTIFGIAGCTALILTGFGLKNSISAVVDLQFEKIYSYDGIALVNTSDFDAEVCKQKLLDINGIKEASLSCQVNCEINEKNNNYSVNIVICENPEKFGSYVNLVNPDTRKKITLDDEGVVVTHKLALLLDIEKGDTVTVDLAEKGKVQFMVSDITENYAFHYIYASPKLYEKLVETPQFNSCFITFDEGVESSEISEEIIDMNEVLGVTFSEESNKSFSKSMSSLTGIVWLLIGCAGALAMVVLYNLANINITERIREIATVKVLGFYDGETSAYIYRENIISAFIGIVFGWILGIFLHKFVVLTAEVDVVMFERSVVWWAFLYSAVLTLVFTALINIILHFKLKKVSMVESLKSVE